MKHVGAAIGGLAVIIVVIVLSLGRSHALGPSSGRASAGHVTGSADSTATDTTSIRARTPPDPMVVAPYRPGKDSTGTDTVPLRAPGHGRPRRPAGGRSSGSSVVKPNNVADDALLQQILATPYGQILLTTARHMKVGRDTVAVIAMVQGTQTPITRIVRIGSVTSLDSAHVGRYMRATLTGEGFAISTADTAEQVVAGDTPTEWTFTVRPTRGGTLTLSAHVAQRFIVGTHQEMRSLPEKVQSVEVDANYVYSASDWIGHHGKGMLEYLVPGGALVGLLKWLVDRKGKPKRNKRPRVGPGT